MNPAGLLPLFLGLALITLGVSGKYKQAWTVISGTPPPGTVTRTA